MHQPPVFEFDPPKDDIQQEKPILDDFIPLSQFSTASIDSNDPFSLLELQNHDSNFRRTTIDLFNAAFHPHSNEVLNFFFFFQFSFIGHYVFLLSFLFFFEN